jgi:UDPglucose 6-dehydrogenase
VVSAWQKNSNHRRDWVLSKLKELVPIDAPDTRVAVWGLAYKEDTHSVKNSPAVHLLSSLGGVSVRAFDPAVKNLPLNISNLQLAENELDTCESADALVIVTPWKQFADIAPREIAQRMRGTLILDPFSLLSADQCLAVGLSHHALGRPPLNPPPTNHV